MRNDTPIETLVPSGRNVGMVTAVPDATSSPALSGRTRPGLFTLTTLQSPSARPNRTIFSVTLVVGHVASATI